MTSEIDDLIERLERRNRITENGRLHHEAASALRSLVEDRAKQARDYNELRKDYDRVVTKRDEAEALAYERLRGWNAANKRTREAEAERDQLKEGLGKLCDLIGNAWPALEASPAIRRARSLLKGEKAAAEGGAGG